MTIPYLGQFTAPDDRLAKLKALVAQGPASPPSPAPDAPDLSPPDDRLAKLKALVAASAVTPSEAGAAKATFGETPASSGGRDFFQTPEVSPIPANRQQEYQQWLARNQVQDADNPDAHYDYRGAFLAGIEGRSANGHWPDTFKQHGHPTFSVESEYSAGPMDGGHWTGPDGNTYVPAAPRQMAASEFPTTPPKGSMGSYAKQYAAGLGGFGLKLIPDIAIQTGRDIARTGSVAADMLQGSPIRQALQRATMEQGGNGIPSETPGGSVFEKLQRPVDETVDKGLNMVVGKPTEPSDVEGRKLGETAGQIVTLLPLGMSAASKVLGRVSREMGAIRSTREAEAVIPEVPVEPPPEPEPIESHAQPNPEREPVPSTPLRTVADVQKDIQGAAAAAQAAAKRGSSNLAMQYQQQANKYMRELRTMKPPEGVTPSEPDVLPTTGLPVEAGPSAPPVQKMGTGKAAKGTPDWMREEMERRGLRTDRPFNDVDLQNPSVRWAIENDPTLTPEQRDFILKTGSPLPAKKPTAADLLRKTDAEMEQVLHPSKGLPEGVSAPAQRASVEKITNEAMDQSAVDELVGEQTAKPDPRLEKLKKIVKPPVTPKAERPPITDALGTRFKWEGVDDAAIRARISELDNLQRGDPGQSRPEYQAMTEELHSARQELIGRADLQADKQGIPVSDRKSDPVLRSTQHMQGARGRWAKRQQAGLTDQELRDAIGYEFGIYGGQSGGEGPSLVHRGGKNPSLEIGDEGTPDFKVLKGKALLDQVRAAYKIPQPGEAAKAEPSGPITVRGVYRGVPAGRTPEAPGIGGGRFFSPDEKLAKSYAGEGGSVAREDLTFQRPLTADNWQVAKEQLGLPRSASMDDLIRAAGEKGHDGIVFRSHNGKPEYVALEKAAKAKPIPATERFTVEPTEKGFGVRDRTRDALIEEGTKGGKLRTRHFPTPEAAQAWIDETVPAVQHAENVIARREAKAKKAEPLPTDVSPLVSPESAVGRAGQQIMDRVEAANKPKRTLKPKAPKPPTPPKTIAFRQSPDEMIERSEAGTTDLGLLLTKAQRLIDKANASSDPEELRRIHSQIRPLYDAAGAGDVRGGIIDIGAAINRKIKKLLPPEEPAGPKGAAKVKFAGVEGGNPKFRKMDNDALIARRHQLIDRIDEQNKIVDKNVTPFARDRGDGTVVSGTSVNQAAGRAIGQIKTAARILGELDEEFKVRGISDENLADALDAQTERKAMEAEERIKPGENPPGFTAFSHGSVAGGFIGATEGARADEKHPGRGAIIGAVAGAVLGARLTKVLRANPVTAGKLITPSIKDDILTMLAPASRGGGGEEAGYLMRHRFGEQAASEERARESLKGFRRIVAHLSKLDAHRFIDHIEQGQIDLLPKPLQPIALALRKVLDETRDEIIALGNGRLTHYYETYFPHIWKDPDKARDVIKQILGKRPLEGNKNFLRKRSIMSVSEGLDAGLELATDNPLDLVLLKHREMRRYLMGQRVLNDFKEEGLAKFVKATEKHPDGYRRIDDRVAEVRGPGPKGAITIRGHYWAPEPVARVINNHLSPGLRGRPLYDGYMYIGNLMNMVQLGLSAFHLGFTSLDAAVSKVALGILEVKDGHPIRAAKAFAEAPIAPITNIWRGAKLRHAYLNGADDKIVEGLIEGGGRVRMDSFWRNNSAESFLHAVQDRDLKGIGKHAIPAVFDMASKPILEWIVPRQKLGVFADLYGRELARLPADATPMMRKKLASKVWDSVDNRMGQMVYDNLFWNRTLKDLAFASVRSVGWNLGTIRELGGGALDLSNGKMTYRASYAIALPITVGLMGAVTTYLYTGHGPQSLKDYFLPPTGKVNEDGNQERVQLPSYVKDIIAYWRHPAETLGHKAQPLLATAIDLIIKNKDYYGDQIRNRDDPVVQQAIQAATYLAKQFIPFGVRNAMQEQTHQQSTSTKVGPFFGMTPAPRELVRSPAQQKMAEILGDRGFPSRTPEEVKASGKRGTMLEGFRAGRLSKHQIADSARAGVLTHRQALDMQRRGTEPNIVQHFKSLTYQQAEDVYSAANADERKLWWPILWKKRMGALDQLLDAGAKTPDVQRLRDLIHRDHLHGPPPIGASP